MVFSMVPMSRPTSVPCAARISSLARTSSIVPDVFQASARSATVRSVFFGPDPPTRMGKRSWIGRGSHRASWKV